MKDLVGSLIPSEQEVADLVTQVDAVQAKIAAYTLVLSKEDRGRALKMRKGGEQVATSVGSLATAHKLSVPAVTVDGMNADLALAARLRPLQTAVDNLALRVDDTILEADGEAWGACTSFYSVLSRAAKSNPEIEAAIKPLKAFFAKGKKAAAAATDSTAQAAETAGKTVSK